MAIIQNGRSVSLEIDGESYDVQTASAVLNYQNTIQTYQTLSGSTSIVTDTTGTLEVTVYTDWAESSGSGLMDLLWQAAEAGTPIAFSMVASNQAGNHDTTFGGSCVPQFPTVGGPAGDALQTTITLVVDGVVTRTYA